MLYHAFFEFKNIPTFTIQECIAQTMLLWVAHFYNIIFFYLAWRLPCNLIFLYVQNGTVTKVYRQYFVRAAIKVFIVTWTES